MLIACAGRVRRWAQSCLEWLRLDEVRCAACHEPYRLSTHQAFTPLFQKSCAPLCQQPSTSLCHLCPACASLLRVRTAGFCARCGLPMAFGETSHQVAHTPEANHTRPNTGWCGECLRSPPPWTRFYMVNAYTGPLRDMIIRAKFHGDAAALHVLGKLLAQAYELGNPMTDSTENAENAGNTHDTDTIDGIVPVPLHPERLRERGYNQCLELARPLAYRLNAPVMPYAVRRTRATVSQRGLSRQDRLGNLAEAFLADDTVRDLRLLVVDDIMTTGSTARHVTDALLRGGARAVDLAVVARVPGNGE